MVRELASRADQRVLRWVWHIERMNEHHMARRVLMTDVSRGRVQSRPKLGWMDGVKVTCCKAKLCCKESQLFHHLLLFG